MNDIATDMRPDRWRDLPLSRLPGQEAAGPEAMQESPGLPPTGQNLICLVGPCRYYQELLMDAETASDRVDTLVARSCRRMQDEDGGELNLQEAGVFACTHYSPPPWSLAGWRTRLLGMARLATTREYYGSPSTLPLTVALWLSRLLTPHDALRDGEIRERE
jgi:hypothetical protein